MISEEIRIHQLLTVSELPPKPGSVTIGEEFSITLAHESDEEQIREWGARFGSFIAGSMEIDRPDQLDQVLEVANSAFVEARKNSEFNPTALETFLEGVLHGGIITLDPSKMIVRGGVTV